MACLAIFNPWTGPCCCFYWFCVAKPETIKSINEKLQPFRDKGIQAEYLIGQEGNPPRLSCIRLTLPTHLGQTSQTFHVQVPPGAGPGQTLQAQAPNGVTLQVQIPQGSAPGTTFEVATPAMPVDVTVAPPTAQVSPAPMEMERAT